MMVSRGAGTLLNMSLTPRVITRRAKVHRDRRDSEPADMDVFDRVKTPEPAGVLEPAA